MEKEIWVTIKNYENYEISNYGKIRRAKDKKYISTRVIKQCGYVYVTLYKNGIGKNFRVHKLVIRHFKSEPPYHNSVVGHLDNDKTNNYIGNLYWTTSRENIVKAVQDNLLVNDKAENDSQSEKIKVIDSYGSIVGVYGSLRECARCVENLDLTFIAKVYKKENYKPRSKKYRYQICTEEEFNNNIELKSIHLVENPKVDKRPTIFKITNLNTGEEKIYDNQTYVSKLINIPQAIISNCIRNNEVYGNYKFELINKVTYMEASGYQNQLNNIPDVNVENIFTKEIKSFKTIKELKDYFGLTGNDIRQYKRKGMLIYSEWRIL